MNIKVKLKVIILFLFISAKTYPIEINNLVYISQDCKYLLKFTFDKKSDNLKIYGLIYKFQKKDSLIFAEDFEIRDTLILLSDSVFYKNIYFYKAVFVTKFNTRLISIIEQKKISKKKDCFIDNFKSSEIFETKGFIEIKVNKTKKRYKILNLFEANDLEDAKLIKDYDVKAWIFKSKKVYLEINLFKSIIDKDCRQKRNTHFEYKIII